MMHRHPSPSIVVAVCAALMSVAATSACSGGEMLTSAPPTSRMVEPTAVPDVHVDDVDQEDGVGTDAMGGDAIEYQSVPMQIWVRNATYHKGEYHLQIATAPKGTFTLQDTRAIGGMNAPEAAGDCRVTGARPMGDPVKGALKNVTHLVTLACPARKPMVKPAVSGTWGDERAGGMTSAYFVLGSRERQGRPRSPDTPINVDAGVIDMTLDAVKHSGTTLEVQVWATQYADVGVGLTADSQAPTEADSTSEAPTCTTKYPERFRPGVKTRTRQALFVVTCEGVEATDDLAVDTSFAAGDPGQEVEWGVRSIPLTPHRAAAPSSPR